MSDQLSQIEKAEKAEVLIDKILPFLPEYGVFHFAYYAKDVLKWPQKEVVEYAMLEHHVRHLALHQFKYLNERTEGYYYELTDIGRLAKFKGGHFKYLNYLNEKSRSESDRQNRKDKSEKLDLQIKEWQVKTKYLPYLFSLLALVGTFISLTISFKALNKRSNETTYKKDATKTITSKDTIETTSSILQK